MAVLSRVCALKTIPTELVEHFKPDFPTCLPQRGTVKTGWLWWVNAMKLPKTGADAFIHVFLVMQKPPQKRPNPLSEVSTCVCLWAGGSRKQKVVPAHSCTVGGGTHARSCSDSANHHRRRIWGSGARSQSEFESRKRADRYDVFFFTFNKTWAYFSHKHCSDQSTVELKVFLVSCIECLFHLITVKLATELTFTLHAPSL